MKTLRIISSVFIIVTLNTNIFAQVGNRCTVKNTGAAGTCKISSDCPEVEQQAQNGISPTLCGFYELTTPIVCCESNKFNPLQPNDNTFLNEKQSTTDSFVYPENESSSSSNSRLSKSEQKCLEYSKLVTSTVEALPLVTNTKPVSYDIEKCDYAGLPLIVGGSPAAPGEFPFMASIGFTTDSGVEWRCGGTLISEYYILTAAHCSTSRDVGAPSIVRLGDLDLSRTDDGSEYKDYNIARITPHPNYRYPKKYNDIALMQLANKVKFTKFIRPACLYNKNRVEKKEAVATGWGKTDYLAADTSVQLLKVPLTVYDNSYCSQVYQQNKNLPEGIKSTMLCAGELKGGKDTCQGDSGGPLHISKDNNRCKFFVIGITSFGKYCGAANTPAIYTRVSEYVSWIESIVW